MKNNKKLVLGSVVALALSVGVVAPNLSKADDQPGSNTVKAEKIVTPETAKKYVTDFENAKAKAKDQFGQDPAYVSEIDKQKTLYDVDNYVKNNLPKYNESKVAAEKAKVIEELAKVGLDKRDYEKELAAAKTVYDVDNVKTKLLKNAPKRTTINDFNLNEAKKEAKAKLEQMGIQNKKLYEQVEKARSVEVINNFMAQVEKSHEESSKPKMTLNQWNDLENYKKAAIEELQAKGIGEKHSAEINDAKTKYDVDVIKEKILKNAPKITTINEWLKGQDKKEEKPSDNKTSEKDTSLEKAKEAAIKELKAAGITGQIYFDQINKAKTVEGVEALKAEILKAHAEKLGKEDPKDTEKPGKEDPKDTEKPGKEDPKDTEKPSKEDSKDSEKPGKTDPAKPGKVEKDKKRRRSW